MGNYYRRRRKKPRQKILTTYEDGNNLKLIDRTRTIIQLKRLKLYYDAFYYFLSEFGVTFYVGGRVEAPKTKTNQRQVKKNAGQTERFSSKNKEDK